MRRKEAGQGARRKQDGSGAPDDRWVRRVQPNQLALNQPCRRPCHRHTEDSARGKQDEGISHDRPEHIALLRAQGHADADGRAVRHAIRQDSVNTDGARS